MAPDFCAGFNLEQKAGRKYNQIIQLMCFDISEFTPYLTILDF